MTQALDVPDRLDALEQILSRDRPPSAIDNIEQDGVTTASTVLQNLVQGLAEDRLLSLTAELQSRAGNPDIDTVERLVMRLLLDEYRDAVQRFRAVVRIAEQTLRVASADVQKARRRVQRESDT